MLFTRQTNYEQHPKPILHQLVQDLHEAGYTDGGTLLGGCFNRIFDHKQDKKFVRRRIVSIVVRTSTCLINKRHRFIGSFIVTAIDAINGQTMNNKVHYMLILIDHT